MGDFFFVNEHCGKLQDILCGLYQHHRVVVHGFFGMGKVCYLYPVAFLFQVRAVLLVEIALRVGDHIASHRLLQIGRNDGAGLAGAASSHHQDIIVQLCLVIVEAEGTSLGDEHVSTREFFGGFSAVLCRFVYGILTGEFLPGEIRPPDALRSRPADLFGVLFVRSVSVGPTEAV